MATGSQPKRFSGGINALRFFGAVVVVLAHGGFFVFARWHAPQAILNIIQARSLATSLFFLISGFVVTQSLCRRGGQRRDFLLRRVARLYPVHVACFAILLCKLWFTGALPGPHALLLHCTLWVTMTHGFFPQCLFQYNYSTWAVTAFMAGYLILPGLVKKGQLAPREVVPVTAVCWLGVLIPNLALVWVFRNQFTYSLGASAPGSQAVEFGTAAAHTCVVIRVLEMMMGAMLAMLVNDRGRGTVRALRFLSRTPVILACAAAIFCAVQCGGQDDRLRYLLSHGLLLPLLAVLVMGVWQNRGLVDRALGGTFLQRAGKASLLIYFLHVPVMELVEGFGGSVWGAGAAAHGSTIFLAGFATTLALAFALQPKYDAFSDRLSAWLGSIVPQAAAPTPAIAAAPMP